MVIQHTLNPVLFVKEEVILFYLPCHSTHLTQPLNKRCFGPLKATWKEVCHDYLTRNPGKVVTRYSFSQLFGKAWTRSMNMTNLLQGFVPQEYFHLTEMLCYQLQNHKLHQNLIPNHCAKAPS